MLSMLDSVLEFISELLKAKFVTFNNFDMYYLYDLYFI